MVPDLGHHPMQFWCNAENAAHSHNQNIDAHETHRHKISFKNIENEDGVKNTIKEQWNGNIKSNTKKGPRYLLSNIRHICLINTFAFGFSHTWW